MILNQFNFHDFDFDLKSSQIWFLLKITMHSGTKLHNTHCIIYRKSSNGSVRPMADLGFGKGGCPIHQMIRKGHGWGEAPNMRAEDARRRGFWEPSPENLII